MRSVRWAAVGVLVWAAGQAGAWAAAPANQGATEKVQYYALLLDGKKVGYARESRQEQGGEVAREVSMELTITRLGTPLTVRVTERTRETTAGAPLGFASVQDLGRMSLRVEGEKTAAGEFEVVTTMMGRQQRRQLAWPEGALLGEGLERLSRRLGLQEGTAYAAKVFEPFALQAVDVEVRVGPKKKVDLFGRVVELTEVETTMRMGGQAVATTGYVNDEHDGLKTTMMVMGMQIEMVACEEAFARSPNDVADFVGQMMLASPTALEGLEGAKAATYRLRLKGAGALEWAGDDNQQVRPDEQGGIQATVRPVEAKSGESFPYQGSDAAAAAALAPTTYVQSDDERVRQLAREAVGDAQDAAGAAARIEAFVGRYVEDKNLSVGYGSAAEVARTRAGDCSEHALLTAAMCRATGIPARVAVGYVYTKELGGEKGAFAGHAWTQAYLGGRWVGLDATRCATCREGSPAGQATQRELLKKPSGCGVGHLLLATGNGDPQDFFQLLGISGKFQIAAVQLEK